MEKKNNKKGFTLAELLIVVAIIAVLVAIAIPVFTTQLEKSREATDIANVRSAYAQVMTQYLTNADNSYSMDVSARQTVAGWTDNNSGTLVIQKDGTETPKNFEAVTSGGSYRILITSAGVVTVNGN